MTTTTDTVSMAVPSTIAFHDGLEPVDLRIYLALAWFVRAGIDRPTQEAIGELAGVHRETVRPSLRRLVTAGAVTVDTTAAPHGYTIAA